jgi:solute:Na+ symporter, SSS family
MIEIDPNRSTDHREAFPHPGIAKPWNLDAIGLTFISLCLLLLFLSGCRTQMDDDRGKLVAALQREMVEQHGFVKVHAAEALLSHGYRDLVRVEFEPEVAGAEVPYSIGVHRVLAQVSTDLPIRASHVDAIRRVAFDTSSEYRVHAIESLAKLNEFREADRPELTNFIATVDDGTAAFAKWLVALSKESQDHERLAQTLRSAEPMARLRTAYALSRTDEVSESTTTILASTLESEPFDSMARVYLLGAVLRHCECDAKILEELQSYLRSDKANEAYHAGLLIGYFGDTKMMPALQSNLASVEPDARIGAADGILRLLRREGRAMSKLDWSIVAGFLLLMLVIGIYYSFNNQSRDEYLLGSRKMNPIAVGISYFATMFSTITYLSWPGEIIRHGPMMLASLAGLPIAVVIVNYWIIPHFMRLPVTSAYEILEIRLGLSIRMLGSFLFLLMRLCWMAVIVHTTTVEILIPVAGFDPKLAPYLSFVVCFGTIVYTALGGFKAVVVTDVAQTLILLGATIVALVTISAHYGGLGWFPTAWEPHWQRPVFGYDSTVRVTFLGAILSTISWQVCTAGSDQMAVQRYLATRDEKAARRMYSIALLTNFFVCLCLAALGLSLYAFFKLRPEMLNLTQNVENDADQFFQQFVVVAMPSGICGLVVAGLISAAMDSLSSGINSSSSVVTVDFIERFYKLNDASSSQTARMTSWALGLAVVGLSTLVGMVSGNLLEVTYKVVNLLTTPLFGLFFMALFVKRATAWGTWVGVLTGVAVVVLINFWKDFTGSDGISFIWGMPLALLAQIVVGWLASMLPIGPPPKPMLGKA